MLLALVSLEKKECFGHPYNFLKHPSLFASIKEENIENILSLFNFENLLKNKEFLKDSSLLVVEHL